MKKGLLFLVLVMFAFISTQAQTTISWSGSTSGAWLTTTNWTGGVVPGSKTLTTNNDIAYFNLNNQPTSSINMNTQGGAHYLGALNFGTNATTARTINNSSPTVGGTFYLNGVTLNGVNNTIIWNQSAATNTITNGSNTMNLGLNNTTNNVIQITGTGGITVASAITGSNSLTKAGSGSGVLQLTGANTYTGTTTVSAGTLQLNKAGGTTIPTTNDVVINGGNFKVSTSQTLNNLTLASGATLTIDVGATLTINGTFTHNGGTITNNGTIAYGAGANLVYSGSALQTLGAEWPSVNGPTNVQVNNSSGFRYTASRSIAGNFTVTSGDVQNNSGTGVTLTLTGASPTLSVAGSITGTNVGAGNDINLTYTNTTGTLTISGGGSLCRFLNVTNTNTGSTILLSRSLEIMFGTFTENGILQLNGGGSISSSGVAPTYGASSKLIYNTASSYANSQEWTGGGTTVGLGVPQDVTIQNNTTLTTTAARGLAGNLSVANGSTLAVGGTLTLAQSKTATIDGSFQLNTGGYAAGSGTGSTFSYNTSSGTLIFNTAYTVGSFSGTSHIYFPSTNAPFNVTVNSGASTVNFGDITRTIAGTFDVSAAISNYCNLTLNGSVSVKGSNLFGSCSSGTLTYSCSSTLTYNSGANPHLRSGEWGTGVTPGNVVITNNTTVNGNIGNATICGNLTINSGSSLYMDYGSSGNSALTVGGNLVMSGNLSLGFNSGGDMNIAGNWTHTTGTFNANSRLVTFNGTSAQTITNTSGESFTYLTINNTNAAVTAASSTNITVSNTLNISANSILNMASNQLIGASLVTSGTGTLKTQNTSSTPIPSGRTWSMIVEYNGTAAQTAVNGNYATLQNNNTTAAITANGTIDIANNVTVAASAILDMATNQLTGATLTTSGTGTLKTQNTSSTPIPSGRTWSMTVEYNGSSAQTAVAGNYATLINSNTAANVTANGTIDVSTLLNIAASAVLDMGTNQLTGASLTTSGTGTLKIQNTSSTPIPSGRTWSMNVEFNGSAAQTITGTQTFTNFTLNNTNGVTLNNDITINNTLTFTAGKITTGSNKVIMTASTSVTGGGTGWVIGNLQKNVAAGSSVVRNFEVGDASNYSPVSLNFASVTTQGDLLARVDNTEHPSIGTSGIDATKSVNRYWSLTNSGVVFTNYAPTFTYVSGDNDGGTTPSNYVVRVYDGSSWATTTISGTPTNTSAAATSVTIIGSYAIGETTGAPTVSTQPTDKALCSNASTSISAASSSTPTPTAQWQVSTNGGVSFSNVTNGGIYSGATTNTLSISSVTGINGYMYRVVYTNINGTVNSNNASLIVGNPWKGITSSDWNTGSNWYCGSVPATNDNISIYSGAPFPTLGVHPVLPGNVTIASIWIDPTMTLTLNGNTLTINGTVTGTGTTGNFIGSSTSNLVFNGAGAVGTINFSQTTDGTTNALNSLTVNKTAGGLTLGSKLVLLDNLTPTAGTLTTGGYLHLRSTVSNTAKIAQGSSSGGYISGDVTVERYISASTNRAYRMLGSSATTSTTIKANWQEGKENTILNTNVPADVAGYGTHITGPQGNTNGFDVTQNGQYSLYTFDQAAQDWLTVSNTNVNTLNVNTGYLIFLRGNRDNINTINTTTGSSNATLRAKGAVAQGDQTISGLASDNGAGDAEVSLVANPFAAPIDWSTMYTGTNATNFENYVTIWDPNVGTRGGYITITNGNVTSGGTTNLSKYIQSGQAFFVTTKTGISNPSLTILESNKATTNNLDVYRTGTQTEKLNIHLKYTQSGITRSADGVVALFANALSNNVDENDALQLANWDEDICLLRNGKELSIESRDLVDSNDSLFIKIANVNKTNATYTWEIAPSNFNAPDLQAFLLDKFTNTSTPVSLSDTTRINFTVTSALASQVADRFTIVFKNSNALPVTITKFAAQYKNNAVQLNWATANEIYIREYIVEKSNDGNIFTAFASVKATNLSAYVATDNTPVQAANYYRLKMVEQNGRYNYSNIVKIQLGKKVEPVVTIHPNPVVNNQMNVQFVNAEEGKYRLDIYNKAGQKMYQTSINHAGGSSTQTITLSSTLPQAIYTVKVSNSNGFQQTQTIIKQ